MINRHVYVIEVNAASRIHLRIKMKPCNIQNMLFHSACCIIAVLTASHRYIQEAKVIYCASFVPRPVSYTCRRISCP